MLKKTVIAVLLNFPLFLGAHAHAGVTCSGWVGAKNDGTGAAFEMRTDIDHGSQTAMSGVADDVHALLLYFKETEEVEISVSDLKTGITAGSHGSFNGQGLLNTGFSFRSVDGKSDRRVLFECRRS